MECRFVRQDGYNCTLDPLYDGLCARHKQQLLDGEVVCEACELPLNDVEHRLKGAYLCQTCYYASLEAMLEKRYFCACERSGNRLCGRTQRVYKIFSQTFCCTEHFNGLQNGTYHFCLFEGCNRCSSLVHGYCANHWIQRNPSFLKTILRARVEFGELVLYENQLSLRIRNRVYIIRFSNLVRRLHRAGKLSNLQGECLPYNAVNYIRMNLTNPRLYSNDVDVEEEEV
jgi:hypothetical protein